MLVKNRETGELGYLKISTKHLLKANPGKKTSLISEVAQLMRFVIFHFKSLASPHAGQDERLLSRLEQYLHRIRVQQQIQFEQTF